MTRRLRFLPVLVLLMLPSALALAYPAKVVSVHDGDTITVLDDEQEQHKIRLTSVNAPELGQPYDRVARQDLADLVAGKMVEIEPSDTGCYGRTIAIILLDSVNVKREMVSRGAAWA